MVNVPIWSGEVGDALVNVLIWSGEVGAGVEEIAILAISSILNSQNIKSCKIFFLHNLKFVTFGSSEIKNKKLYFN